MRVRIQLFFKVMGICDLQGYIFNVDFNEDPDLAFHSNADPIKGTGFQQSCVSEKRIRIPKIMDIQIWKKGLVI